MLEMNKNLYNAFVRCNQRLETDGVNENRTWDVVVRVCEHTPSPSSISPRIVDLNELIFYIIMSVVVAQHATTSQNRRSNFRENLEFRNSAIVQNSTFVARFFVCVTKASLVVSSASCLCN